MSTDLHRNPDIVYRKPEVRTWPCKTSDPYCLICLLFTLVIFTLSCSGPQIKGYKKIQPHVYFKLHAVGDELIQMSDGDLITIRLSYSTLQDSVFYKSTRKIRLEDPGFSNSVYACINKLYKGDSASFIFRTTDFFLKNLKIPVPSYLSEHKQIKINISVIDIQTAAQFESEKRQFLDWTNEIKEVERKIIHHYLEKEKINFNPTPDGMYFILTKAGTGKRPEEGDVISINYEGKFLDGHYFDSTKKRNDPLTFKYGKEFMVIKGIEKAIGMMREGDKAVIILPSELAFGSDGAGDGLIPPFTALIYELELLKVCKNN